MLDLFGASKTKAFSADYFKAIVRNYVPAGIDKEVQGFIYNGKTIELDPCIIQLPIEKNAFKPGEKTIYQIKAKLSRAERRKIKEFSNL